MEIDFNYERAVAQANELETKARELKKISSCDLSNSLKEIRGNWSGENAEKYLLKGAKLAEEIESTSTDLSKIADAVRQIADKVREAEELAKTIINNK